MKFTFAVIANYRYLFISKFHFLGSRNDFAQGKWHLTFVCNAKDHVDFCIFLASDAECRIRLVYFAGLRLRNKKLKF